MLSLLDDLPATNLVRQLFELKLPFPGLFETVVGLPKPEPELVKNYLHILEANVRVSFGGTLHKLRREARDG